MMHSVGQQDLILYKVNRQLAGSTYLLEGYTFMGLHENDDSAKNGGTDREQIGTSVFKYT